MSEFSMPSVPKKRKSVEISDPDPMDLQFKIVRAMPLRKLQQHYLYLKKSEARLQWFFYIDDITLILSNLLDSSKEWANTADITAALERMIRRRGGLVPRIQVD